MENLSEEEIVSYVDEMKNFIFKSYNEKNGESDYIEGELKEDIFILITEDFEDGAKITNVEFEKLLKNVISKLSKKLQDEIEGLPEFLAYKFSFDVISQTILAKYIPDDENKFDPMFS